MLFVLNIPPDFSRRIDRGEQPQVLMDADATDPTAIANATAAVVALNATVLNRDLPADMRVQPSQPPFQIVLHARYNPEQITALNIVPGLIGLILTVSTLVMTSLAITRERESGTMENLLAMPVRPVEVMLGKIIPYVGLAYVQTALILPVSVLVFRVPVRGSIPLLLFALGVFIACNLAMGFAFSTMARTQMQAQQLAQFGLLPSIMLSGFMFPFMGMPAWARYIGEAVPLTHTLRICRGVLLKGNGLGRSGRTCGRWRCSRWWWARSRSACTARRWTESRGTGYIRDSAWSGQRIWMLRHIEPLCAHDGHPIGWTGSSRSCPSFVDTGPFVFKESMMAKTRLPYAV